MARSPRTTSLARGIVWSSWWRHLLAFVLCDLVLFGALVACFAIWGSERATMEGLPQGALALQRGVTVIDRIVYDMPLANGEHQSYALSEYLQGIWPLVGVVGAAEVLCLILLPFSTRRVRRRLQPLNDLALTAEELGNAATWDMRKIENLEQAIHSATLDAPRVSTGDKDLQSIEIALNGLLRQMQEAKLQQMRFVSDASHELRTPISVIQGYVNMLDRWGKTDEAVLDESIAALKAESSHMQELVEQLLFLARGDSGRNALQHERISLATLLGEVCEESRLIDADHTYTLDIPGGDAQSADFFFTGDPTMVKQGMRILVQNAAAYAPAHTHISLRVAADATEVSYAVQDEGMGMSQQDAEHVFERFWRADAARTRHEGGTGLGLSIAKWIADAHHGSIEVLSREDVGTRFTVRFPKDPDFVKKG